LRPIGPVPVEAKRCIEGRYTHQNDQDANDEARSLRQGGISF
jgi:hypothetical protein